MASHLVLSFTSAKIFVIPLVFRHCARLFAMVGPIADRTKKLCALFEYAEISLCCGR